MGHIFGHKFTATFGETAYCDGDLTDVAKTWASGLRGLTGEQIASGLHECVDCDDEWPTLPMFVAKCKGTTKNRFGLDYVPECYRGEPEVKALPIKKSDPKTAKDWIKKMRKANSGIK